VERAAAKTRRIFLAEVGAGLSLLVSGGAKPSLSASQPGWMALLDDRTGLANWDTIGEANWRMVDGVLQADRGGKDGGYLVSKTSYRDVAVRAEFWVSEDANSGIFIRCSNRAVIAPTNSYEVNIFDNRPDPSYGTGAIVAVAKVNPMPRAAGRWNVYQIAAQGDRLTVSLNGVQTVSVRDNRFPSGPIALQYGGGIVKFRSVQVRPL